MGEWKECQLGDVLTFQRGFDLPHSKMVEGPYPVMGSNGIIGWHNEYTTEAPSVTIGRSGSVGLPHLLTIPSWSHNTVLFVKDFKGNDPRFLYYFLFTLHLNEYGGGSAVPTLNRNVLHELKVCVPDLPTQRRIAAVLGALDDKIEVNRRICENLEAQAQALFKAWFVDFEPFGGKRPEGWKMGELGSLIEVCYGKDHKKRPDGNIPVYGSGGYMRSVDIPLYGKESVLIPRKGSLNNILYVNEAFWTVDTMFYSKMRVPCVAKYVHQFLKAKDMEEMNVGSAVPSMTTDILNHMQVPIPDALSLSQFDAVADALYSSIKQASRESRALAAMRDALLPKLMSGELAVEKVEVGDACASHTGQGAGGI